MHEILILITPREKYKIKPTFCPFSFYFWLKKIHRISFWKTITHPTPLQNPQMLVYYIYDWINFKLFYSGTKAMGTAFTSHAFDPSLIFSIPNSLHTSSTSRRTGLLEVIPEHCLWVSKTINKQKYKTKDLHFFI